jgi:serine/threonine-protein kinase
LLVGQRLGHFELLDFVGGGGMGAVFRARDTMLNREVAVKVLSRDQGADEETRRRFQNEAQSAARLDHENIARVYYVGEDRGLNYIVFEFIEGVNLRDLVERRGEPLPLAEAISYTLQLAKALDHASHRDVVHRDIKPSNVLVTDEGRAKLVDMGLARLHQVDAAGMDLTASGVTLGTFDYISPEQARDPRSADVRSDMYSLGCTLYYMLTARPPFPEGTVLQKLLQHNSDEAPDPREFNPEVTDDVATLVRKMLVKNPRKRYQSPSELIDDLVMLAEQVGLPSTAWGVALSTSSATPRHALLRHLPWVVPSLVLLLAVGFIEFASKRGSTEPQAFKPVESPIPDAARISPKEPSQPPPATAEPVRTEAAAPAAAVVEPQDGSATASIAGAPRAGLLIVAPEAHGPQQYNTLRAACSAAKSGDVIELRYNGRREERPMQLSNRRFTIRAGEGFQPVVVFRPDESDPLRYPRSMFGINGGKLSLVNVAIELLVPPPGEVPAMYWDVIEAERCESLELHRCSLTVRNAVGMVAQHPEVAFFHVRAALGFDSMMAGDEAMPDEMVDIDLENCIIRGEAVLLRVDDVEGVALTWDNGFLATTERLVTVVGGVAAPRSDHHVRVVLRHITANLGAGLCQMVDSPDKPFLPLLDVQCSDSILTGSPAASLIDQQGIDEPAAFRNYVTWNADRNFYNGFDAAALWRIEDPTDDRGVQRFGRTDWDAYWGELHEVLPEWNDVQWRHTPVVKPASDRTPDDDLLAEAAADNMARSAASDGRDAGMIADALPPLPGP